MFREIPSLETGVVQLDRDSTLVCFTDGLVEQENVEGVPFGMQRMEDILRERRGMPVKAVQTALIDSVKEFKGEEPSFDDTALMVVRFH
jgi:sigma-B regulation protein RsbU (phosphoserine phosphatase)